MRVQAQWHNTRRSDQEVFSHSRADGADGCRCRCFPLPAAAVVLRLFSDTPAEDLCLPGPTHGHRHTQTAWAPDWSEFIMFLFAPLLLLSSPSLFLWFLLPLTTAQEVSCSSSFALNVLPYASWWVCSCSKHTVCSLCMASFSRSLFLHDPRACTVCHRLLLSLGTHLISYQE